MAVTLTGTKTVTANTSPKLTGVYLTTLMAIAVENMTVQQHDDIHEALQKVSGGAAPNATLGSLLI